MAIPFAALAIGQGVLGAASGIAGARARNRAAKAHWRNALIDQSFQNRQNQRALIESDRGSRQSGYDAALEARAATASAKNSAASGGVSGTTVDALIAEQLRIGARNQSRIEDQREYDRANYSARAEGIRNQTQSRINSVEGASFGVMDMAQIALNAGLAITSHRRGLGPRGDTST